MRHQVMMGCLGEQNPERLVLAETVVVLVQEMVECLDDEKWVEEK
jgi:hypothetical protein